jgi:hypothetical protein
VPAFTVPPALTVAPAAAEPFACCALATPAIAMIENNAIEIFFICLSSSSARTILKMKLRACTWVS